MGELAIYSLVILVAAVVFVVPIVWVLIQVTALAADAWCFIKEVIWRLK